MWADLSADDETATRAVLALSARPREAVAFLKGRLTPLKADKEQVKKWLNDLGSDKEEVWKPAFERMTYLDPRLALDFDDLADHLKTEPAGPRLAETLLDRPAGSLAGSKVELQMIKYESTNPPATVTYLVRAEPATPANGNRPRKSSSPVDREVVRIGYYNKKSAWVRAVRAIVLLGHIATPEAVAVLKDVATGHPGARPTKAAQEALARLGEKAR